MSSPSLLLVYVHSIVPQVVKDYGQDVILNAGTGIMDHPDGPSGGVKAFFASLDLV